jgi:hypothetical protein
MGNLLLRPARARDGGVAVYLGVICLGLVAIGLAFAFLPAGGPALFPKPGAREAGDPTEARRLLEEKWRREANWHEISPRHWRVVGWVLECTNIREVEKLPHYLREFFNPTHVGFEPLGAAPDRLPHHHEIALVQISRAIADHRQTLLARVRSTYRDAQTASLVTVILGFITTVVVSFNSTSFGQGQGRTQQGMRFLAIFLTALGTDAVRTHLAAQRHWTGDMEAGLPGARWK